MNRKAAIVFVIFIIILSILIFSRNLDIDVSPEQVSVESGKTVSSTQIKCERILNDVIRTGELSNKYKSTIEECSDDELVDYAQRESEGVAAGACGDADLDGDGNVGVSDLLILLANWGPCDGECPADLDGDGNVGVSDLLGLLANWGEVDCPLSNKIGMNLPPVEDWEPILFNDIFKQSRGWWWNGTVGSNTLMVRELYWGGGGPFPPSSTTDAERYPLGDYKIYFEGDGEIKVSGSGSPTQFFSGKGEHIFTVTNPNQNGISLEITQDMVSNIRVILPGYNVIEEENEYGPFYTPYVESLNGFEIIRFMDVSHTNNHPCSNGFEPDDPNCETYWEDRAQQTDERQTYIVAWEYLIELCNFANVNGCWFTIPHAADDNYIEQLAILIKDNLDTDKEIYLEYSNEVWNSQFDQNDYAIAKGQEAGYQHPFQGWVAKRSADVFCSFEEVFGNDERLVKIIPGQFNNPWHGDITLGMFNDPDFNVCGTEADAYTIAPYFADNDILAVPGDSVDDVLDKVSFTIHEGRYFEKTLENQKVADNHGVRLITYEGGQHLVTTNDLLADVFVEANRVLRMKDLYLEAYEIWKQNTDGDLHTYFHYSNRPSQSGTWGHLEYIDQEPYVEDADGLRPYKWEAILEILG